MSSEGTAEKTPPAGNRRYQRQGSSSHGEPGTSEALDTETGRTVALRTFEKTSDPLALARFHREADLLRRLDHPGVVRVLDAGVDEGAPFLVLELQKGKTLAEWVAERKRLAEGHALALIAELARALAYAHAKGALSIDLSPENVVVVLEHETGPRPVLGTGDLLHAPRSRAPELGGREAGK
ncbi:protein kinase [bacterium]|nr:protein kinase [bacterium]